MTAETEHLRGLERMYLRAPVNSIYDPDIKISDGESRITIEVKSSFHHAAGGLHGAVIFKMLDDSSYFAVNSMVEDVCVLTASYNLYFMRPVKEGRLTARGRLVQVSTRLYIAESEVVSEKGRVVAKGSGYFARSSIPLKSCPGYKD